MIEVRHPQKQFGALTALRDVSFPAPDGGVKEAHTYLSMLVFLPMGLGMFMVFSPVAGHGWWKFVPLAGHQWQLDAGMRGAPLDPWSILFLGCGTAILAGMALVAAADRLERDDVVYGG